MQFWIMQSDILFLIVKEFESEVEVQSAKLHFLDCLLKKEAQFEEMFYYYNLEIVGLGFVTESGK